MRTSPLTQGDSLPALTLFRPDGTRAQLDDLIAGCPLVVYFMRTPTCPVCNAHLRQMQRSSNRGGPRSMQLLVVVPGDPSDAAYVAGRHPELATRIASSADAHHAVGLFVKSGLQQSGTFVVDPTGKVIAARAATIPLVAYDETEVLQALDATRRACHPAE